MTDTVALNQNRNGVDLREVTDGSQWPVETPDSPRMMSTVVSGNPAEDAFQIEVPTAYEVLEYTVNGDAFLPHKTEVSDPMTDESFAALAELVPVTFYAIGHERLARGYVEEVDHDKKRVRVSGEVNCQSLHRWVDQSLIMEPGE